MVIVTMVTKKLMSVIRKLKVCDCNHGDNVKKGEGDITGVGIYL